MQCRRGASHSKWASHLFYPSFQMRPILLPQLNTYLKRLKKQCSFWIQERHLKLLLTSRFIPLLNKFSGSDQSTERARSFNVWRSSHRNDCSEIGRFFTSGQLVGQVLLSRQELPRLVPQNCIQYQRQVTSELVKRFRSQHVVYTQCVRDFEEWRKKWRLESPQFAFWDFVLALALTILTLIHSLREADFCLIVKRWWNFCSISLQTTM